MYKIVSPKEAIRQKALIPLNIVVFILCLAVVYSLIFTPIIKVNVGQILSDEQVSSYLGKELEKKLSESNASGARDGDFKFDYKPLIISTVKDVLSKAKGEISFSTVQVCRYALDPKEEKLTILFEDILSGDRGLVNSLVTSLVACIENYKTSADGKQVIENAVVDSLVSSMGAFIPDAAVAEKLKTQLTEEKVGELKDIFFGIDNATSEEQVVEVVEKFVDKVDEILGETQNISQEDKEKVKDYVVNLYNDTLESIEQTGDPNVQFSVEAMISLAASKNIPLGNIDISQMLSQYLGQLGGNVPNIPDPNNPDTPDNPSDKETTKKALTEGETTPSEKPALSYSDLFGQMGLDAAKLEQIKLSVSTLVTSIITTKLGDVEKIIKSVAPLYYKNIYLMMLGLIGIFVLLWAMLALTALVKIFKRNKRFSMWYVKAVGFIPALVFVVLSIAKISADKLLTTLITGDINISGLNLPAETARSFIMVIIKNASSGTWICGVAYIALWILSFIWAYPLKRSIRKERKNCKKNKKNGDYSVSDYESEYGYSVSESDTDGSSVGGTDYDSIDSYSDDYSDSDYDDYTQDDYSYNDDID